MGLLKKLKGLFSKRFKAQRDIQDISLEDLKAEGISQSRYWQDHCEEDIIDIEGIKTIVDLKDALSHFRSFHKDEFIDTSLKNVYWEKFLRFLEKELEYSKQSSPSKEGSREALEALRFFCRNGTNEPFHYAQKPAPIILGEALVKKYKQTLIENHFLDFFRTRSQYPQIFVVTITYASLGDSGMGM